MNTSSLIRTPDQRLRVFVSSTLHELADERAAVKDAIEQLRLAPVMFELGARPHPAISLYRAYLEQSHIFIGVYWQSYGYIAPGMETSGLEDEYVLAGDKPKLIYIKTPAQEREMGLGKLLSRIKNDDRVSYKYFSTAEELRQLVENDLALLLTERFEQSELMPGAPNSQPEAIPHNLPAPVTSFIGREAEIAAIIELLEGQGVRLLTLIGPGGTGKTRLSLQVLSRLFDQYEDGLFFISLAEAKEPALVVSKIAETLGIREGGSQSLLQSIKGFLRDKHTLLLLDNFEQVLEAAPLVSELLGSASKLKILVTSRALLNVRGEHEFLVPPLQLPSSVEDITTDQLAGYESIRMFIERVTEINPHYTVDDQSAPVIAEICRRLDGLPLAIELAAARVKIFSPRKMLSLLSSRLNMLTGGSRDLPERQQTLRSTLEWSVQLLSQDDQALFARLGVFIGGFTLESAQEVCHGEEDTGKDIITSIESLLNNSLVQTEYRDGLEPRFRMLETIREYAQEKLDQRGELEPIRRSHAQYFIDKMNIVNPTFYTHDADRGLEWVDAEHDNLRAALAYCFEDASLLELSPWLLTSMNWPWYRRGFLSEGRDWANRLLRSPVAQGQTLARSYALWSSGAMAMWQGDVKEALVLLTEAVDTSKSIEFPIAVATTLLFLGTTQVNRGDDKIARGHLEEALEIYEQFNMPWYQAVTLVHMGNASLGMGDTNKARAFLDRALPISRDIRENWLVSFILNNYGEVARTEGDYLKAQEYYEESEGLLRAMGDKGDLARVVHNLGCVARHTGDLNLAENRFKESLAMFIKLGNQRGMAECLASMAGVWSEQGRMVPAVKLLGAAQALLEDTGGTWWPADRVEVNKNQQILLENLEPDQYKVAWESGKKLTLGAALNLVKS